MVKLTHVAKVETAKDDHIVELRDHNNEVVLRFTVLDHDYARVEAFHDGQIIGTQYVNPMQMSDQITKALKSNDKVIAIKTIEMQ